MISPVRSRRGICCLHTTDWAATTIDIYVSVLELRHPTSGSLVGAPSWLLDSCLLAVASNYLPQCVHKGRDFSLPLPYKDTNLLTRALPPWPCPNLITSHSPPQWEWGLQHTDLGSTSPQPMTLGLQPRLSELGAMPRIPLLLLCIIAAAITIV